MFRFCRIIEDKGQQYLLRAANNTCLVCNAQPPGPTSALTIDTWISDGGDWDNLRLVLNLSNQVTLLLALECFTEEHAREARRLLVADFHDQLTTREYHGGVRRLCESVIWAIWQKYGPVI